MKGRVTFDSQINNHTIYAGNEFMKEHNLTEEKIYLHFGTRKQKYHLKGDHTLAKDEIKIGGRFTDEISIPDVPYEFHFQQKAFHIGPVIGYLTTRKYCRNPDIFQSRFNVYNEIKGLVFIFNQYNINMSNKTIAGLYYDPKTKSFVKGTFPYPTVLYNRLNIKPELYHHFRKYLGVKIYNYPFRMDKWTFWKLMSQNPGMIPYLPHTEKFTHIHQLERMSKKYAGVYIKPFNLSRGRGILHLKSRNKRGYVLTDNNGRQFKLKERTLSKKIDKKLRKNRQYVIQQDIPFKYGGHKTDFRVYIQKDESKRWGYSQIVARSAHDTGIVTNPRQRNRKLIGMRALKEIYDFDEKSANRKLKEIIDVCIKALKILEKNGYHIGDAAIDLVIDQSKNIKLLEVQLDYSADIKSIGPKEDKQLLPFILYKPLKYAKALSRV